MSVILGSTGITFPDSTTQTTAGTGTVSSVATGTGLTGGTITTSGTISIVTTGGAVGTYALCLTIGAVFNQAGATQAGSLLRYCSADGYPQNSVSYRPSGTWQCMGFTRDDCAGLDQSTTIWTRIA